MLKFVDIGYGTIIQANRIITVADPNSSPIKARIKSAKENGQCLDVTYGRPLRSVLVMDNGEILLSAVTPGTIMGRLQGLDIPADAE